MTELKSSDFKSRTDDLEGSSGKKNSDNADPSHKVYTYSEAIALVGNGWYNVSLLMVLSLSLLAMCIDLFSFSVVVTFCSCDFHLSLGQKSFLVSIPFVGPVITAYAWGYICDTRGRRKSLILAMSVSFLMSTLCAFAPNWIALAIFKLVSTCCCSCAQSASYTLLGESCIERVKGHYMIIMSSVVHLGSTVYFVLSYWIDNLYFSYDLGLIEFVPWRLLVILLALPLGASALGLFFFYESPKFLLNSEREDEAIEVLRCICMKNGGQVDKFNVQKLILDEVGNVNTKDVNLLRSMWEQTAPLFKPPLLLQTLLLYYLVFVMYSANSGLYIWLPFITKAFTSESSNTSDAEGLCSMINITNNNSSPTNTSCGTSNIMEVPIVIASVVYGTCISILNCAMYKLASRKKTLVICLFVIAAVFCLVTTISSREARFFYYGILTNSIAMGPLSSYYVELYPTSFRGMAACLGVMMARLSSIIGINLVGPFIMSSCYSTFYGIAALLLSGAIMSCFLPSDRPKKTN